VANGVDGYVCCDCQTQFFIRKILPSDGLAENEIFDPEENDEILCPECGSAYFEEYDEWDREYTCICGHRFQAQVANEY
jgi:DNA-directed RNA polymerase subunit RPC12/RpoP